MATLVSTGQITIVDNNDAKPITAFITNGSIPLQQIYSKNNGVEQFLPSRSAQNLVLTVKAYVGAASSSNDISLLLTGQKWSYDLGSALSTTTDITVVATTGQTPTLTVKTNNLVTTASPNKTIYFEGDYTDPGTGLTSHIICKTELSVVQTGTNAVYIQLYGPSTIEAAVKTQIEVRAELIRSSGIDTDNLTYKWYEYPSGRQIATANGDANVATKYGFRTKAQADADDLSNPAFAYIGQGLPASGNWGDCKAIVIHESAVTDMAYFKVDIYDSAENQTYTTFFTIDDKSDPYTMEMFSTAGEKLQNGQGSTNVYPIVYYGASKVPDLTGWTFNWFFYNKDGYVTAFVDTGGTNYAGGKLVLGNTAATGANFTITWDGATCGAFNQTTYGAAVKVGSIIKIVKADGTVRFYETNATPSGSTVVLRNTYSVDGAAVSGTYTIASLSAAGLNTLPTANEFVNARMFLCTRVRTTSGGPLLTAAQITITGDDIDIKGNIQCQANMP